MTIWRRQTTEEWERGKDRSRKFGHYWVSDDSRDIAVSRRASRRAGVTLIPILRCQGTVRWGSAGAIHSIKDVVARVQNERGVRQRGHAL